MFFSSRKRSGRVQSKGTQRQGESSMPLTPAKTLLGCFVVLCVALTCGVDRGYWDAIMGAADGGIVDSDPKELETAIDKALGKDRRELGLAGRAMKPSFDALRKDDKTGQVNARTAGYMLQNYFSNQGWRIQGLAYQAMRPTSGKGLDDALLDVAVLKNLAPGVHDALRRRAASREGFTLKQITGLAAVIKGKLLNEGHVSTVLRMLYRRYNVSFDGKISQTTLENITEAYITHFNVVDTFADPVVPAFKNVTGLALLKTKALEHAYALAARSSGKNGAPNVTTGKISSVNYSSQVVAVMAENLTRAFEKHYSIDHCEDVRRFMSESAPEGIGRLRLSAFYSKTLNGTLNFAEPKRHLRTSGALDESDKEADNTRVLIANYLQGHLNCIRHTQYYSLCCPNQCVSIMQDIEASLKSPAATPQRVLDIVANLSSPSVEAPRQMPATLVARLEEISERHGGVVPLHGRLFAQWLHYTFPNECQYPQEKDVEMKKTRVLAEEVSIQEREEIAWATLNKGLDIPATRLHTAPWSNAEVLPLQEEQVWVDNTFEWRAIARAAVCILVVLAMANMTYKLSLCSHVHEDQKLANDKLAKLEAFENRLKRRVELLNFEFNVELTPGKAYEQAKLGMYLQPAADPKDGLVVEEILPGGIIHMRNDTIVGTKRVKILAGDHLISVNGKLTSQEMMEELSLFSNGQVSASGAKTCLRFSRAASRAAPLTFTADLERSSDEVWGMALSEIADNQNSKELTVSRVVAGGPVDKWNRRFTRKNKPGIYPGDIIIACSPEVDCKKILARIQEDKSVRLTILRWQASTEAKVQTKAKADSKAVQSEPDISENAKKPREDNAEEPNVVCEDVHMDAEEHRCACCDAVITDKFVVMSCSAGEVKYYRRTCWRQKHGGFTIKHMPRRCTCGSPLAKVEVFERSAPTSEPRLIHTILDGPMEVDIRMDEAAEQEERPTGIAQRRSASATRRAAEGDVRRRAKSSLLESYKGKQLNETITEKTQSENSSEAALVNQTVQILQENKNFKAGGASDVQKVDAVSIKPFPEKSCREDVKKEAGQWIGGVDFWEAGKKEQHLEKSSTNETKRQKDPWFVGADLWEAGKAVNERDKEAETLRFSSNASHNAGICIKDPWLASQEADPWAAAKNKKKSGAKVGPTAKLMTESSCTKTTTDDLWFCYGTDPWEASSHSNIKIQDPWFASADADPWKATTSAIPYDRETKRVSARSSSRGIPSSSTMNPLAAEFVPGRSLPSIDLLLPQPPPPLEPEVLLPQPLPQLEPPQGTDFEPPPGLPHPVEPPPGLMGAPLTMKCSPPPGLPEPPHNGLSKPPPLGMCNPPLPPEAMSLSTVACGSELKAPPGLFLVDAPPGLEVPLPVENPDASNGGTVLPQFDAPIRLSAPPGLPEPDIQWSPPSTFKTNSDTVLPQFDSPIRLSAPPGLPEPDIQWSPPGRCHSSGSVDKKGSDRWQ